MDKPAFLKVKPRRADVPPLECEVIDLFEDPQEDLSRYLHTPLQSLACQVGFAKIQAKSVAIKPPTIQDFSVLLLFNYAVKTIPVDVFDVVITGDLIKNPLLWLKYRLCESPKKAPDFYQSPVPFEIIEVIFS